MTLKTDIDQLAVDALVMHQVIHADASTTVTTAGGPVRSIARLISDKDAEINISASGILAQSVAQVGLATQQAIAAGNSLSQVNVAVAQALSAAGTVAQYSTALAAIASQTAIVPAATVTGFNRTVVASCIHNARDNSDGGAKRRACQEKTWYAEPTTWTGKNLGKLPNLAAAWAVTGAAVGDGYYDQTTKLFYSIGGTSGAPTRAEVVASSRLDMPEVVGVTVDAGMVVLWDATDASMPMWRVFKSTAYNAAGCGVVGYMPNLSSCSMVEGVLAIGNNFSGSSFYGSLIVIDFYADTARSYSGAGSAVGFTGRWNTGLGNRHVLGGYDGSALPAVPLIINSVAAYVYPNAPFNPLNGLKKPTIAVGATAGVTVLKDNDSSINITYTSYGQVNFVWFGREGALWFANGFNPTQQYYAHAFNQLPTASVADGFGYVKGSADIYYSTAWNVAYTGLSTLLSQGNLSVTGAVNVSGVTAFASQGGLFLTKDNPSNPAASMMAAITTIYNTGWQIGDSRGAWLADTGVETVSGAPLTLGAEINTNATYADGVQTVVAAGLSTVVFPVITVIGKTYAFRGDVVTESVTGQIYLGAGTGIYTLDNGTVASSGGAAPLILQFVAKATTTYLQLRISASSLAGEAITWANVGIAECATDRSIKANSLTVFGSLTKAPVAAGSQLVAWSGFAAGMNYLKQDYSANLDFGTGDFCLPVWINPTTAAQTSIIFQRAPAATLAGNSFGLALVGGVLNFWSSVAGAAASNTSFAYSPPVGQWKLVNLVRVAGVMQLRVNGVQQDATIANTTNYNNTTAALWVGLDYGLTNPFLGSLALLRASATPASADQEAYRYETERKLFLPGAQHCIAGTSSSVNTIDYDDSTNLLSVATSWGVTEFQGLKAVNSYATTVGPPSVIATRGGYKLLFGATGSSFYKPSRLLSEEMSRTFEQRMAFGAVLKKRTYTATSGQADFNLGIGEEPVSVYQMGILKDEGAGAGLYTVSNNGFRKTIRLGTTATLGDRVTIFYTLNL